MFCVNPSLAPLVKKICEQQVLEMTNKLCDKLLNGKEQNRDIASIALKTIVAEVPNAAVAQSVLVSISPKLQHGIVTQVSPIYSSFNFSFYLTSQIPSQVFYTKLVWSIHTS